MSTSVPQHGFWVVCDLQLLFEPDLVTMTLWHKTDPGGMSCSQPTPSSSPPQGNTLKWICHHFIQMKLDGLLF